jgi:hypothetical protein
MATSINNYLVVVQRYLIQLVCKGGGLPTHRVHEMAGIVIMPILNVSREALLETTNILRGKLLGWLVCIR